MPQTGDRGRPRQAISGQSQRPLEVPECGVRHRTEDSVDRAGRVAAPGEDVLHRRHVPAAVAALHRPAAERRAAALAERAARLRTHHAIHGEAAAALEAHDCSLREWAANTVHGRVVETDSLQGNLNRRDLWAGERRGG